MFKYYKLSLYSFALASMLDILLSGNKNKEYILKTKEELESLSWDYRKIFDKCSQYLEDLGHIDLEANLVKGIGITSNTIGKAIGGIPFIKEGKVDEFLQDSGTNLKDKASDLKLENVKQFAILNNPDINVFTNKMDDLISIYNNSNQIYFDRENIYIV